jgi:Ca2+-binding EF-hand superfamily protein
MATTMRTILTAGALLAAVSPALAAQDEALKRLSGELPALLKAADADADGALSVAEFRGFEAALKKSADAIVNEIDPSIAKKKADKDLKKYDANTDGKLDDQEIKAQAEAKRLKDIKDFDWDGDGKLSEREETAMKWAAEGKSAGTFRKADANADGKLGADEISGALAALAGIKVKKAAAP